MSKKMVSSKKERRLAKEAARKSIADSIAQFKEDRYRKEQEVPAMEKWEAWYKLCCDWYIEPQSYDTWNGCVDTMCSYFREVMCGEGTDLDEIDKIMAKAKKKFES